MRVLNVVLLLIMYIFYQLLFLFLAPIISTSGTNIDGFFQIVFLSALGELIDR